MRSHRGWQLLRSLLLLAVTLSCTPGDFLTEPSSDPVSPLPVQLTITGSIDFTATNLLSCSPQRYVTTSRVVGPGGDKIKVGSHVLVIPPGALSHDVTIVAEQITGSTNSVRFSPEGLQFALPAALTMSYANCDAIIWPKSVVYTDEQLKILEQLRSVDKAPAKSVTSPIGHFSRYAVAY
jgi:hypothetical protein